MGDFQWHGDEFLSVLTAQYDHRLDAAAEGVAQHMRQLIATQYPPASSPGEPPHRRTGALQSSIRVANGGPLVRRIGSDLNYSLFLELGTRKMAARPYMARSLSEEGPAAGRTILEGQTVTT